MEPGILLIGDYPPPHGGVAVHVKQLHAFLLEHGVRAKVLDIGKGRRPVPEVLPVHTPRQYVTQLLTHAARGWLLHLHTSGNNLKSWLVAASVAAAPGRGGKVLTLHSGLLPSFLASSRKHRAVARAALWGMDRVVAVSEVVRDAVLELGVPREKVSVLPAFLASAVRPGALPPGFGDARDRRALLLAMAHHPSPVYGRDEMFRALKLMREEQPALGLAVFGPGTREPAFLRSAREHGVDDLIEDFGELPQEQVLALLRGCDVFVRPTTADGDAISVREALTLSVPTVASDVAKRPDFALTYRSGDARALANKIGDALRRGRVVSPTVDAGPALMALYAGLSKRFAELQEEHDAADGGRGRGDGGEGAEGAGHRRFLERLGRGPALQNAHHADPLQGQPDSLGQQHW